MGGRAETSRVLAYMTIGSIAPTLRISSDIDDLREQKTVRTRPATDQASFIFHIGCYLPTPDKNIVQTRYVVSILSSTQNTDERYPINHHRIPSIVSDLFLLHPSHCCYVQLRSLKSNPRYSRIYRRLCETGMFSGGRPRAAAAASHCISKQVKLC